MPIRSKACFGTNRNLEINGVTKQRKKKKNSVFQSINQIIITIIEIIMKLMRLLKGK